MGQPVLVLGHGGPTCSGIRSTGLGAGGVREGLAPTFMQVEAVLLALRARQQFRWPHKTKQGWFDSACLIVREGGLEPPRPKAQEPKSCASANSATRAPSKRNASTSAIASAPRPATATANAGGHQPKVDRSQTKWCQLGCQPGNLQPKVSQSQTKFGQLGRQCPPGLAAVGNRVFD